MLGAAEKRRKHKKHVRILTAVGILLLVIVPLGISKNKASAPSTEQASVSESAATSSSVAGTQTAKTQLKKFSDDEFQSLYESLALPNTELITSSPEITGDTTADAQIVKVAKSRGYSLRSVPVLPIVKTNVPGLDEDDLLQPKAYEAWKRLEAQAKKDGVALKLNSGYRSIDWQRRYFLLQLQSRGITPSSIASGQADAGVSAVMSVVAPPGYSRHHTGYTVDFTCKDGSGKAFEFTSCFDWLSKNNYQIAKQFGWIPSYPDGADNQGPEPEPWEYVWVGTDATYE